MRKSTLFLGLLLLKFGFVGEAQMNQKVSCYSGEKYPSCTSAQRLSKANGLARATTAAVIIEARQGIACGDGSDGCYRTDTDAIAIIGREVKESELWQNLTNADPKTADVLLKFSTRDRASLQLCCYSADSNDLLWCESRSPSIALDNDSFRLLSHFLEVWRASKSERIGHSPALAK
jgi:hypothetical protein